MLSLESVVGTVDLSTDSGIEEAIARISELNIDVNRRLDSILGRQCQIESKMNNVSRTLQDLSKVEGESIKLSEAIQHTAELAENVSAKVRRLDEARSRVSECQQRVHDLIDLQLCSQGVIAAINNEDFEKGAGHIQRFLSMDQNLLQRTADDVSESITSVSQAVSTLEEATTKMRQIVQQKFDEAVKKDDMATVERFFKIYPLLGMYDQGIERFSQYICGKLAGKSQKELRSSMDIARAEKRGAVAYADTLTVLFENIARVIDVNQPIIENFYGFGYLIRMYVVLQKECDAEVRTLIQEFQKGRQIQRRRTQINDYIKSFTGQTASTIGHFRKSSGGNSLDKLDPKEIDRLIGEITMMHSRSELYIRFMRRKISTDLHHESVHDDQRHAGMKLLENTYAKSDLNRQMQELLGIYLLLERYFMEESVLKAISLNSYNVGLQCSSMVDDVFFILRKSIRRSITTQSLDGICAVINNAAACFEGDFITAIKAPLKAGYPSGFMDLAQAYSAIQTSIQHGKLQTNDTDQGRQTFIVQLNNADISTEYIETLWTAMEEEIRIIFPTMTTKESEILDNCLSNLKAVRDTLKGVVDYGLQQLRNSAIKPRLQTWIDQFMSHNHELSEEELSTYEASETFVQTLIVQLDGFLNSFKVIMSPRNYDALVSIVAGDVTNRLERVIRKTTFNRLGGLILDQEIRALGSYLTSATSWSVRDKMVRLTQISTLLNLEQISELTDYWNSSNRDDYPAWRFSDAEVRTILALRSDFKMDDIKRIKI